MNLPRYMLLSGASLLLAFAVTTGCGGSGSTGGLSGSGGGSSSSSSGMDPACKTQFPDQSTDCANCLEMHCASEDAACCAVADMSCAPLAKEARSKACSGADCYGTDAMPGPIKGLIDDFGGPTGPGWTAALPLIECTVMNCDALCPK